MKQIDSSLSNYTVWNVIPPWDDDDDDDYDDVYNDDAAH